MTRKELSQIYYINREILMWKEELEKLRHEADMKSKNMDGMPRSGDISDTTGNAAVKIVDVEMVIIGKLKEIQIQRAEIMRFMESIESSYMRQVVYYRHVLLMNWQDIAEAMGGDCNRKSVQMMHSRWLKKMEAENDKRD